MSSTTTRVGWRNTDTNSRPPDLWNGSWENACRELLGWLVTHANDLEAALTGTPRLQAEARDGREAAAVASAVQRGYAALKDYDAALQELADLPSGRSWTRQINGRAYWLTVEPA